MTRDYRTSLASRERNRMHARKTRQRKKEHMQNLQSTANDLKENQLKLRQIINEKTTANILVGLFSKPTSSSENDPKVEELLGRPVQEIPDPSKIPELPALILPGQHNSKKNKALSEQNFPDDGIDYELLGKDRSKCTPAELDQIRRERNRMHAKRTRDRKRIFMEEMEEMIKRLEEENQLLTDHIAKFDGEHGVSPSITPSLSSPPVKAGNPALLELPNTSLPPSTLANDVSEEKSLKKNDAAVNQIKNLLEAAGAFNNKNNKRHNTCMGLFAITSVASVVSATHSADVSVADDQSDHSTDGPNPKKKQRLENETTAPRIDVPTSITTGCH
mmetsp:Transcript_925/g.1272  ORF Transcript_925/g.1272 Transcript_925/m.1272 type:complete len:332 (-) Transcript_925:486-1481(-)